MGEYTYVPPDSDSQYTYVPPDPPAAPAAPSLSRNPLKAGAEGFKGALGDLKSDFGAMNAPETADEKKAPGAGVLRSTPRLQAADRFGGDVLGLVSRPVKEALASIALPIAPLTRKVGSDGYKDPNPRVANEQEARDLVGFGSTAAGYLAGGRTLGGSEGELAAKGAPKVKPVVAAIQKPSVPEIKVGTALHKAIGREGTTPGEVIKTLKEHPTRPAFHAGGDNMVTYAKAVARTPGPGKAMLKAAVRQHQKDAHAQVKSDIGTHLGGRNDYFETLDKAIDTRRQAANKVMDQIGDLPVKLDEHSVHALGSELSRSALNDASTNALASPNPLVRQIGGFLRGLNEHIADPHRELPDGVSMRVRDAQDVSRALLDAANAAYSKGDGSRGKALKTLGRAIRDNAADPALGGHPEYGAWLRRYGHDSDNEAALDLGYKADQAGKNNTAEHIRRELKDLKSPDAIDHYRKGLAEALMYRARGEGGVSAMRKLLKSDDFREKVKIAFPKDEDYDAFVESAQERVAEQERNNRVISGSDTAENLEGARDLRSQGMSNADKGKAVQHAIMHPARTIGGFAAKKALELLPEEKSLLDDPITHGLLGRALSDPAEMERLLKLADPGALKKQPIVNPPGQWGRKPSVLSQVLSAPDVGQQGKP